MIELILSFLMVGLFIFPVVLVLSREFSVQELRDEAVEVSAHGYQGDFVVSIYPITKKKDQSACVRFTASRKGLFSSKGGREVYDFSIEESKQLIDAINTALLKF